MITRQRIIHAALYTTLAAIVIVTLSREAGMVMPGYLNWLTVALFLAAYLIWRRGQKAKRH